MIKKRTSSFVWDAKKERDNIKKHGVDFQTASRVFEDPRRKIIVDSKHSQKEQRYFCIGKVEQKILTVRFVYKEADQLRIIGAGYWRKGVQIYAKEK